LVHYAECLSMRTGAAVQSTYIYIPRCATVCLYEQVSFSRLRLRERKIQRERERERETARTK